MFEEFRQSNLYRIQWDEVEFPETYEVVITDWSSSKITKHANWFYIETTCLAVNNINALSVKKGDWFRLQISSNTLGYKLDRHIQFLNCENEKIYLRFTRSGRGKVRIDECKPYKQYLEEQQEKIISK